MSTANNPPPTDPQLVIIPNSVDFKNVVVGQKNTQTLQISNTGAAPLIVSQVKITGNGFSLSSPALPLSLKLGQRQNITVAFDPKATGNSAGTLTVMSNDPHSPGTVTVAGVGEKAVAKIQISPAAENFGNEKVQVTTSKNVTLSNTGNVTVTISGVTVAGAGFGYANITPGFSLAPQQQMTFQVWFKPMAKGAATGKLSVLSANLSSPVSMALSGNGTISSSNQHTVKLDWNPSTSPVTGYLVYRGGASGGPYARVTSSQVAGLSYADSTVNSGATYYYVVTAVDTAGIESRFSNETSAVVPTP